jgi:hypothetical protein
VQRGPHAQIRGRCTVQGMQLGHPLTVETSTGLSQDGSAQRLRGYVVGGERARSSGEAVRSHPRADRAFRPTRRLRAIRLGRDGIGRPWRRPDNPCPDAGARRHRHRCPERVLDLACSSAAACALIPQESDERWKKRSSELTEKILNVASKEPRIHSVTSAPTRQRRGERPEEAEERGAHADESRGG